MFFWIWPCCDSVLGFGLYPSVIPIGSVCMPYMVTFAINIPQPLAYIPYMDPMGYVSELDILKYSEPNLTFFFTVSTFWGVLCDSKRLRQQWDKLSFKCSCVIQFSDHTIIYYHAIGYIVIISHQTFLFIDVFSMYIPWRKSHEMMRLQLTPYLKNQPRWIVYWVNQPNSWFWLVVWFGTFFIFPYIWNNHPNWLIFFRGVQTTNQDC